MSNIPLVSTIKEKKRPSVSSKCLLNIRSIVSQNVSLNSNNKNSSLRSSATLPPPLPLVSSKESINQIEIEDKKRNKTQNLFNEVLPKSSEKKTCIINEHNQSNVENGQPIPKSPVKEDQELSASTLPIISKELNLESHPSQTLNNNELSTIPPLPLSSSMYPFGSSSLSPLKKPLSSFPVQSSNRINEGYVAQMCHIIASSSSNPAETKPIELPIYRQQSMAIHRFDSDSPTISTLDDEEDDDVNLNSALIFINRSLDLPANFSSSPTVSDQIVSIKSRLSQRSEKEYHQDRKVMHNQYHPRCPTNYARLPHSLRNKNLSFNQLIPTESIRSPLMSNSPLRRSVPQFESVRTPIQKSPTIKQESPSMIPSEVFDCCQTETVSLTTQRRSLPRNSRRQSARTPTENECDVRSNSFRDAGSIREIMLNVSKRLTQDLDSSTSLPIVDTHCHFDLIFDRLRIKHNNLKQYFLDYEEFYPSGLSFELAIQVFWRPKQLIEKNWINWYSKYLDDERVYGSCGIHPHWSSAWTETSTEDIERCLQHPKVVAIGEIGLDFGPKNECLVHEQRRAFEGQLKLAAKWLKPIVIHSRDAYQDTFELMKQYLEPDHKIHLHCFVGTIDDVHLFTSYFTEIKFGFTPIITRFNFLHTVIQQLELTQILSETDSPYFTPDELQAYSRCAHPGMVYSVVEMIAQLRHLPIFDVACQLRENARYIYGI